MVLGLVLQLGRGHVLGDILGAVLDLVPGCRDVLGLVLGIGDVLGSISSRRDVRGAVLGLVLVFRFRDVLNLGFVHRVRDVLGDVLRYVLGVVVSDVLGLVECGGYELGLIDCLVHRYLGKDMGIRGILISK